MEFGAPVEYQVLLPFVATYGLRNHQGFFCSKCSLLSSQCLYSHIMSISPTDRPRLGTREIHGQENVKKRWRDAWSRNKMKKIQVQWNGVWALQCCKLQCKTMSIFIFLMLCSRRRHTNNVLILTKTDEGQWCRGYEHDVTLGECQCVHTHWLAKKTHLSLTVSRTDLRADRPQFLYPRGVQTPKIVWLSTNK